MQFQPSFSTCSGSLAPILSRLWIASRHCSQNSKLRYLRGREPLPGYDALDAEDISTALHGADLDTVDHVREYERKFRRRPAVLDAVSRARRQRRSTVTADS